MSALGKPISLLRVHPCACIAFLIFFYLDDSFLSKEESISNQVVSQVIFDNGINQQIVYRRKCNIPKYPESFYSHLPNLGENF